MAAPTPRPQKLYEVFTNPNTTGVGLRATQHIPVGTILLREKPLFSYLVKSKSNLSANQYISREVGNQREAMRQGLQYDCKLERKIFELDDLSLSAFKGLSFHGNDTPLSRAATNSFSEDRRILVYHHTSRINHSCAPNAVGEIDRTTTKDPDDADERVTRACRDIAPGEEITIAYFIDSTSYDPVDKRQAYTRINYSFICACPRCSSPVSEGRTARLYELYRSLRISQCLKYGGATVIPKPVKLPQASKDAEKFVMLLREEGIEDARLGEALLRQAQLLWLRGGKAKSRLRTDAEKAMERALQVYTAFCGEGNLPVVREDMFPERNPRYGR
ncbi:SET domain-containing protein [Aulographum hederae CBS 113979]|uniref:SET domain-containing protein n=1 Tax=Aulographum hederae CBS 113979 TaxID=1176131 RepID=A0A6G1HHV1_9PEZI|nr:SET domain-containing protein [Aulographum hederae CBS 113979]